MGRPGFHGSISAINVHRSGVIHSIHFHRLILDEAHSIKVRSSPGSFLISAS